MRERAAAGPAGRPRAAVHVDLDGLTDISRVWGWPCSEGDDPIFRTGLSAVLDFCEQNGVRATLFVVASSLADTDKREMLREAVARGHEIASHSVSHPDLRRLSRAEKRRELAESRDVLESALGVLVRGFRAPGYSLDRESAELLAELGYGYDSSVTPTPAFAERLGVPAARLATERRPFGTQLAELPLPDYQPLPLPFSPSYALLFGQRYFRLGFRLASRRPGPFVLLYHLIDFAAPLATERLTGTRMNLLTLSHLGADEKRARCQAMLDLVRTRYDLTTTAALLAETEGSGVRPAADAGRAAVDATRSYS